MVEPGYKVLFKTVCLIPMHGPSGGHCPQNPTGKDGREEGARGLLCKAGKNLIRGQLLCAFLWDSGPNVTSSFIFRMAYVECSKFFIVIK
jgi:hypothetical protein